MLPITLLIATALCYFIMLFIFVKSAKSIDYTEGEYNEQGMSNTYVGSDGIMDEVLW